jgi:two-component system sensor histidine kinase/response regulator
LRDSLAGVDRMIWKSRKRKVGEGRNDASPDSLLAMLGAMVFECNVDGSFPCCSPVPSWVRDFVADDSSVRTARDLPFAFLGVLLDTCVAALKDGDGVPDLNEIWHERDQSGEMRSFRGRVVSLGDRPHLVVQCQDVDFVQEQDLYQQAREQKLALDALAKAEAALRESQQRLGLMMRQAPAVFWCADRELRLTYCSGSARELLTAVQEELVGSHVMALFEGTQATPELVLSAHEIALAGETSTFDVQHGDRSFDVRVEPLRDHAGDRIVGVIGVGVESSERVKAEARAAAALQAKADFVTGISHEIRTPMNAIVGLTELALDLPLSAPQEAYLQSSISSAESLLGIIDQLLDFSRAERGSRELDNIEFSLSEVVFDVAAGLAVRAHARELELTPVIDANVPELIVGDCGRLRQILVNLVGNAIKFTHEGEIRICVHREEEGTGEPGCVLHFVVSDTGIGILPDKQELIFDAFRQAEPGTIRRYGGTGLGLSIASELARSMGGRIWVVSPGATGVGSEFHVTVRLEESLPSDDAIPVQSRDDLPSSCILVGFPGTSLAAARRSLESCFGEIVEIQIPPDVSAPVFVPTADASGVIVLDVPVALKMRERMFDSLACLREFSGRVVALSPVGLPPAEMEALRELSGNMVLKPVHVGGFRDALVSLGGESGSDSVSGYSPTRLRLLIAEDDELSQWVLASICRNRGHEVTLVSSGEDTLAQAARRPFDVLLLDIQLPDCDGYSVARQIRKREDSDPDARRVAIVALTAHVGSEVRERCLASGMDGYLSKPVRARELFSKLEGVLIGAGSNEGPLSGSASSGPLDMSQLEAFVGGDASTRKHVLDTAVKLVEPTIARMDAALKQLDFAKVKEDAHRLKGMAGNIGAADLSRAAARLEECVTRQDQGGGRARLVELRSESDRLMRFLGDRSGEL